MDLGMGELQAVDRRSRLVGVAGFLGGLGAIGFILVTPNAEDFVSLEGLGLCLAAALACAGSWWILSAWLVRRSLGIAVLCTFIAPCLGAILSLCVTWRILICAPWAIVVPNVLTGAAAYLMLPKRAPSGHCSVCSYNLHGNVSGKCPECGTEIRIVNSQNGRSI